METTLNIQRPAIDVSRFQSVDNAAARVVGRYRVSYTLSKSMNNVGESFFSSPIDPFDLSKDWGRSDNDHRHRLTVDGSLQRPTTPVATLWQRLTQGFHISGTVQRYSALPLNILSGLTTIQGTASRPVVNGNFIAPHDGMGSDFVIVNARVNRTILLRGRSHLDAIVEAFNLTNHVNVITRNTNF